MSLIRIALRTAGVEALRGRTWAGTRVYDSNNAPIDVTSREAAYPFLSVFCDNDEREVRGRDIFAAQQKLQFVVELGIGAAIPAGGDLKVGIPSTDAAFERGIDALERQVLNALCHDGGSEWGEIWRNMVNEITRFNSNRGGEADKSSRWAARAAIITLDAIADPVPGMPLDPEHPLARFLTECKVSENETLHSVAAFIENEIDPAVKPQWRQAQGLLGLTEPEVRGIGEGPPYMTPDDETDLEGIGFNTEQGFVTEETVDGMVNPAELPEPEDGVPPAQEPPPQRI